MMCWPTMPFTAVAPGLARRKGPATQGPPPTRPAVSAALWYRGAERDVAGDETHPVARRVNPSRLSSNGTVLQVLQRQGRFKRQSVIKVERESAR